MRRSPLQLSAVAPGPGPLSPFSPAWGPVHPHLQLPSHQYPHPHLAHLEVHPGTPHLPYLPSHLGCSTPRTPDDPSVFFPRHPGAEAVARAGVPPHQEPAVHQPAALQLPAAPRQDEPLPGQQVEVQQERRDAEEEEVPLVEEHAANIVVKAKKRRDEVVEVEEEDEEDPDMAVERQLRKEEQKRGPSGRTVVEVEDQERVGRRGVRCRLGPLPPQDVRLHQEFTDPRQPRPR